MRTSVVTAQCDSGAVNAGFQLHSSLNGGSLEQGGIDELTPPAPPLDADTLLDAAPLLDVDTPRDP
jgi:hypothetical protein